MSRPDPPPAAGPPDRATWQRLRPLLEELLQLPAEERAARLAARVEADDERAAVAELLSEAEAEDPLDRPPVEVDPADVQEVPHAGGSPGERAGPWELRRRLGGGGMGDVWLAVRADGGFTQRAALKRVRPELTDDEVLARFRRERQVLASLEDPAIARLIDGGVDADGRPYLAMEYVDGVPIDRWCDERRLDVRARVALLSRVARAVDVAHAQLVVHRDLKPSNVLIDGTDRPRLIDFGVAKVLDPEKDTALVTRDVARFLTPAYASPEQLTGDPVSPASDVYSLGALTYELLAGRPPLQLTGLGAAEAVRRITEDEPPPLAAVAARGARDLDAEEVARRRGTTTRALARALGGDLDVVVRRCLRKEPARRYARASELADDLERWLAGRPVEARRDGASYRVGRFVRRHRVVVSLTLLIVASLTAGLVVAWQQRSQLARQSTELSARSAASARLLDDLRASVEAITSTYYPELAAIPGTERVLGQMVRALVNVAERQDDPRLLAEAVRAQHLYAESIWKPFMLTSSDPADSLAAHRRAREMGLAAHARHPRSLMLSAAAAAAMSRAAWSEFEHGELVQVVARGPVDSRWMVERTVVDAENGEGEVSAGVALSWIDLQLCRATALDQLGRPAEALELLEATRREAREFGGGDLISTEILRQSRAGLARQLLQLRRRYGEEIPDPITSETSATMRGAHPLVDAVVSIRISEVLADADHLEAAGDLDTARSRLEEQLASLPDVGVDEAGTPRPSVDRARLLDALAGLEMAAGNSGAGLERARAAVVELERLVEGRAVARREAMSLRLARLVAGRAAAAAGDAVEAGRLLGLALEQAERDVEQVPEHLEARLAVVDASCELAALQAREADARAWWERAARALEGARGDALATPLIEARRARVDAGLGR